MLSAPCLTCGWQLLPYAWGVFHVHSLPSVSSLGNKPGMCKTFGLSFPIGKKAIQVLPALKSFASALFVMLKMTEWLKVK